MTKTTLRFLDRIFDTDEEPDKTTEIAPATDSQQADEIQDDDTDELQPTDTPAHDDMTDQVLEVLKDMGFQPEQTGDIGYSFMYEGARLLYMPTDNDSMIKLAIPCIYEVEEDKLSKTLVALTFINRKIRYAKSCLIDGDVWLFYEHALFNGQIDLRTILRHMIPTLDASRLFAQRTFLHFVEENDQSGDETDGDSGDTDTENKNGEE